jgi:hypothetical protein
MSSKTIEIFKKASKSLKKPQNIFEMPRILIKKPHILKKAPHGNFHIATTATPPVTQIMSSYFFGEFHNSIISCIGCQV